MSTFSLTENLKVIQGLGPTDGAGGALISDTISVKNYHKLWAICDVKNTTGAAVKLDVMRTTAVGGVLAAVTGVCRIWSNLLPGTSDTLVERTAAITYSTGAGAGMYQVIFEIDPVTLGDGYDCVAVQAAAVVPATDIMSIVFVGLPRTQGRVLTQPSGITD